MSSSISRLRAGVFCGPVSEESYGLTPGVDIELLSIVNKRLEPMLFRVPPKAGSNESYSHVGEEFISMLKGKLEIWVGELERNLLRPGDNFWFESNVGHRWFNPSDEDALLLWINTPLTF